MCKKYKLYLMVSSCFFILFLSCFIIQVRAKDTERFINNDNNIKISCGNQKQFMKSISVEDGESLNKSNLKNNDFIITDNVLVKYNGQSKIVEIPEGVNEIASYAFENNGFITKVVFPKSLRSIGEYAFANCANLSDVHIPENIVEIGSGAFSNIAIKELVIPSTIKLTGYLPFYGCNDLKSVIFDKNLKRIPDGLLSNTGIEKIDIPTHIMDLGNYQFSGCTKLKEVILHDGIQDLGTGTFQKTDLSKIFIPKSVQKGSHLFVNCRNLNDVIFESGIDKVPTGFFADSLIHYVQLPNSILEIENGAFSNCLMLERISFPNNLKKLGSNAFSNTSLKNIFIPGSVESISNQCFSECENLTSVVFNGGSPYISIHSQVFENCRSLTTVDFENLYTELDFRGLGYNRCFKNCSSLSSICIPYGSNLFSDVFEGCTSIKKVFIPGTLSDSSKLPDTLFKDSKNILIQGYSGTYAEQFASKNGYNFETLGISSKNIRITNVVEKGGWLDSYTLALGESVKIGVELDANCKELPYFYSAGNDISVTPNGVVTANKVGKYNLSVMINGMTKTIVINVIEKLPLNIYSNKFYIEHDSSVSSLDISDKIFIQEGCYFFDFFQNSNDESLLDGVNVSYQGPEGLEWKKVSTKIYLSKIKTGIYDFKFKLRNGDVLQNRVEFVNEANKIVIQKNKYELKINDILLLEPSYVPDDAYGFFEYRIANNTDDNIIKSSGKSGEFIAVDCGAVDVEISLLSNNKKVDEIRVCINVNGWNRAKNSYYENGNPVLGVYCVDGVTYYFDENGHMVTGWRMIDGIYYYFDESGSMVTSQWIGNYYLEANGQMAISKWIGNSYVDENGLWNPNKLVYEWQLDFSGWRYKHIPSDTYVMSNWILDNGNWYYFNDQGYMVTGFNQINGKTYYFDENGHMVTGWRMIDGIYYYFDESGSMVTSQWIGNYYLEADGQMAISKWIGNSYVDENGLWDPNKLVYEWQLDFSGWRYKHIPSDTYVMSNWILDNGNWYYFNDQGYMVTGFNQINGKTYYFDENGHMVTGWKMIDGIYYYFDESGSTVTSQWIGNYYLEANGQMAISKWIGNSYVDENGLWDPNKLVYEWQLDFSGWRYKHIPSDTYVMSNWILDNGNWYYFNDQGYMVTGFNQINGKIYYFDENGHMVTGWRMIDGIYYYFDESGSMVTSQ